MKTVTDQKRFEFGKNWYQFIRKNCSAENIDVSKKHILEFLGVADLRGKTFLDIGCGSGLHSLAALEAGVSAVHGFDYDPDSVRATKYVLGLRNNPSNWTAEQGSVLDAQFMQSLPRYDVVYSWGVLHHTGSVWRAIQNAADRVAPNGLFYIALYSSDVQVNPPPEFWLEIKKKYVAAGYWKRRSMDFWYVWRFMMGGNILALPEVVKRFYTHKKNRGMSMFTDIRDWLGGWPMEFVPDKEAVSFCENMGFNLVKIKTGEACTEFLFARR